MADAYTATKGAQYEMSCESCRGVFHGTTDNVIKGHVFCDNCLREAGLKED